MKRRVLQKRLLVAAMAGALAFSNAGMPTLSVFAEEGIEALASARNVLADGTWDFDLNSGGVGSLSYDDDGNAVVNVDAEGDNPWSVQYTQLISLEEGKSYTLSGDFYSEEDAKVFINVQEMAGWSSIVDGSPYVLELEAGKTTHLEIETGKATAGFVSSGKLAIMFGNGSGNAGNSVTVSNMSLVASSESEDETGSGSETGTGENENENTSGDNTGNYDGINELTKGVWDFWTGEGGAGSIETEENGDAVVYVTAEGSQNYAVQYTQMLTLTEGKNYRLTGDFYCDDDAVVFINVQESLGWSSILNESPYKLEIKGGETTHLDITTNAASANFVTNGKLALMFGNGTGNAGKSIKVSNMSLVETDGTPSEGEEETPSTGDTDVFTDGFVDFEKADTELYVGSDWAGADATVKEEGTKATFDVKSFGWNGEWGMQYIVKNAGFKNYTGYTISFDMTSSVDKTFFLKVDDAAGFIAEPVTLEAGKTLHYEMTIDGGAFSAKPYIFFALGQMNPEEANRSGEVVLENLSVKEAEQEAPTESKGNEYDFNNPDNDLYNYADPGTSKEGYDLIWADEFDGNYGGANVDAATGLNLDNWAAQLGDGTTDCNNYGWGNNELQSYTANSKNLGVNEDLSGDGEADGVLRITAAYEPGYVYGTEGAKNYTSARLRTTKGSEALFSTTYGYVEARIALPATAGAWPAFWMLPQSTQVYGGWPVSGEIDIMETCGAFNDVAKDNIACGTLHWGTPSHVYKGSGYVDLASPYTYFHSYAIDWQPGEITWYYDGQPINTLSTWEGAIPGASDSLGFDAPFDMPFYMLLNLAVDSGQFGGAVNKAGFNDDINMYVDYVRVYQKSEGYPESASRQVQGGSAEDWTELVGINQITEIKADNLVDCQGGMDDAYSDYSKWYLATQSDATDAKIDCVTDEDGKEWAHLSIPTAGGLEYSVQLIGHYNAKKGYAYRVSFDAYGSGPIVGKNIDYASKEWKGWSSYLAKTFKLSSTPQTYTYDFVQTDDFEKCRAEFNFGARGTGDVYVSNVKIEIIDPEELGSAQGPRLPLANGNIIFNGSFDQGENHMGYWNATKGTTVVIPRYTLESLKDGDKAVVDVASKTNYEHIADGLKYYERRAQISSENGSSPAIYQSGLDLKADTYTVSFDMYSRDDTAVKASIYSLEMQGDTVALGKELGHAAATYSNDSGVRTYTLVFATQEDAENAALVLTFGKGASVQVDNVYMKGENQASGVDEHPLGADTTYRGDNGSGTEIPLTVENGVVTMTGITSGGNWYSPQLATGDFKLVAGQNYELSFDYKITGTTKNTFQYIIQENQGQWHVFGGGPTTVTVDSSKADADGFITVTQKFTADATIDAVHLNFGFGNSGAVGDMAFSFRNAKIDLVKGGEEGGNTSNDAEEVDDDKFDQPEVDGGSETGSGEEGGNGGESGNGDGGQTGEGGNGDGGQTGEGGNGDEIGDDDGGNGGSGSGSGNEGGNDQPSGNKPVVPPVVEAVHKVVVAVTRTVAKVVTAVAKTVAKAISSIFRRWF